MTQLLVENFFHRSANIARLGGADGVIEAHKAQQQQLSFKTCLREVRITPAYQKLSITNDSSLDAPEINDCKFFDAQAYCFLLEVICGIHSKVLGETEILGQFKIAVKSWEEDKSKAQAWLYFKPIAQQLLKDAKKIREQYLQELGSQSYGSLVRKHLNRYIAEQSKPSDSLRIAQFGAGQLAQEILPWISKDNRVIDTVVRNPDKYSEIKTSSCLRLNDELSLSNEVWILAAPLRKSTLETLLANAKVKPHLVLDLREVGSEAIDNPGTQWISLNEFFESMKDQNTLAKRKVELAQSGIAIAAAEWMDTVLLRPFGWDDVCS